MSRTWAAIITLLGSLIWAPADAAWLAEAPVWQLEGEAAHDALGVALADAGDLDEDGVVDVLVGLPGRDVTGSSDGQVRWLPGGLNGFEPAPWTWSEEREFAHSGWSIVALGDVTGDGLVDVAVGAPGGGEDAGGRVHVFAGGPATLESTPFVTLAGPGPGSRFGTAIAAAGDVDDDGFDDLLVGAPGDDTVLLYRGGPGLEGGQPVWTWTGDVGSEAGAALAAGDVDGDGYADFAVGAPGGAGGVHLFAGRFNGPAASPLASLTGAWDRFGAALAMTPDLTGDGNLDLLVGAPEGAGKASLVELLLGWTTSLSVAQTWIADGPGTGLGAAVSPWRDLDGDDQVELLVGAPWSDVAAAAGGAVLVLSYGHAEPRRIVGGTVPGGRFGHGVLGLDDLTGDGLPDVVVGGGWTSSSQPGQGSVSLLAGVAFDHDVDLDGFEAGPDCDDLDPAVHPGAPELCNGRDDDCDGAVPSGEADDDQDGQRICAGDCHDGDPDISTGADELCDDVDRNCDGDPSFGAVALAWWPDADADGYGDASVPITWACAPPGGDSVRVGGDCRDHDPEVHPGATEATCNGLDDDCEPATSDHPDEDGDGFAGCLDCDDSLPLWLDCGDCDDLQRSVRPDAGELCEDGVDQDCDGEDADCEAAAPCHEADNICDDEVDCQCSTGRGGTGVLVVLPLLLLIRHRRRRAWLWALLLFAMLATPARAADTDLDTQLLVPTFAPWGFFSHPGTRPGLGGTVRAGVVHQYERKPFVVLMANGDKLSLIRDRVTHTMGGWWTPHRVVGFGLSLPLVFQDAPTGAPTPAATGDLHLQALLSLLHSGPISIALRGDVWFPTSGREVWTGEEFPRGAPGISIQGEPGPLTLSVSASALFRHRVHTEYDFDLSSELRVQVAGRLWLKPGAVAIQGEAEVRSAWTAFAQGGAETPAEVRAGVRLLPGRWIQVDVGGGLGLNGGYGAPKGRVLASMTLRRWPADQPLEGTWRPPVEPEEELTWDDLPPSRPRRPKPPPAPEPPPPVEPPPPPLAQWEDDRIVLSRPIEFEHDSDVLLPSAVPVLQAVLDLLEAHPELAHVLVEGHASVEGRVDWNWDLSARRAAAVLRWLVEAGTAPQRLSSRGMGEGVARRPDRSGEVREDDRRVEFLIVRVLNKYLDDIPAWAPQVPWDMPEEEDIDGEDRP